MATLREIADELGVAVSTVSAVVNNRGYISAAMRARVEEALRRADYRPDENARVLRMRESRTVGLIVPDLTNPFYARLMRGAEDYLASLGYDLFVSDSRDDWQRQRTYLLSFSGRRTDGILLVPCRARDDQPGAIERLIGDMPLVHVDRSSVKATVCSVVPDNVRAGYEATQHLLDLGHRRIGIISEPLSLPDGADRLAGYKKALRTKGVPLDRGLVRFGADTEDSGYWRATELLRQAGRPTAIIVCNSLMTLGLLTAVRDAGLTCPRDVSVIGFDDFEWCPHLSPPLSMVRVPAAELGSTAARVLMKQIRGGGTAAAERVLLPTELVIRESTSPPPAHRSTRHERAG